MSIELGPGRQQPLWRRFGVASNAPEKSTTEELTGTIVVRAVLPKITFSPALSSQDLFHSGLGLVSCPAFADKRGAGKGLYTVTALMGNAAL
jgi:hypothetical protein